MQIHSFQHASHEGLGEIASWARKKGHAVNTTHFENGERPPSLNGIDWLIVMGGPMNIYEHRNHPWLVLEKKLIADAIAQDKRVLGICLGAQLIADVLGGKVFQNPEIEIGWFPVQLNPEARKHELFAGFPEELTPLHWHGDTFSLPPGAVPLGSSLGCRNQGFAVGKRVVGLQFHLEVSFQDVSDFVTEAGDFGGGPFLQDPKKIFVEAPEHLGADHQALESLLDAMADS